MIGHKICFYEEIWLIIPNLSLEPLLICCTVCINFSGLALFCDSAQTDKIFYDILLCFVTVQDSCSTIYFIIK